MKKKSETKPKFKPIGKFLSVTTVKSVQKTTDAGIVYEDKATGRYVVSTVVEVGDGIEEDIKPGDTVYWDSKQFKGDEVEGMHIINESWVAVVERE